MTVGQVLQQLKSGTGISAIAHAAILLGALVSFAAKPFESTPAESMPVDVISMSDFSQIMAGAKDAKKQDTPKPLVEKQAEPKPAENVTAPVADKEIVTASSAPEAPPEAKPEPKPPAPQPRPREARAEPKPEPVKPDAEALKKDEKKEPKKEEKTEEAKPQPPKKPEPKKEEAKPMPPKRPEPKREVAEKKPQPDQPKFDANRIAALLDKRQPQRLASAGETINNTATLGAPTGRAATLSQSEIDALRARIQQCWNPPAGNPDARDTVVLVRIFLKQDGSLAAQPTVSNRGSGTYFQVAAESAMRAVQRCAPYSFMPVAKYDVWKDVEITFDPRDMYRG